jgi:CRISPR/Cas system CSM-associated protein Csm2 small subunit
MRPSLNRTTEIKARCTKEVKEQLTRKLISVGYKRTKDGNINPNFVDFLEALADKPLEWFEKNFEKMLDNQK